VSSPPLTWVVGAGGLLGSSLVRRLPAERVWRPREPVAWASPTTADQLVAAAREFLAAAGDDAWQVAWCAGAGVTASAGEALAAEAAMLDPVLSVLGGAPAPAQGGFFLASSAGGVYAGSRAAPFDEETPSAAISPYGEAKLGLEARVRDWHHQSGVPVLVGRIANLYGPGQNLGKAQGLISQVIRAHLRRRPISVYVPLDTVRDNLFVTDAARLVDTGLARLRSETAAHGPQHVLKVLASQQGVTVGYLIAELGRLFKRRPHVVYGLSAHSAYQARDLRLRSIVWPELDHAPLVPLPVGMARTARGLARALGDGSLT
jgi:UDP-glucose 4-epimerase